MERERDQDEGGVEVKESKRTWRRFEARLELVTGSLRESKACGSLMLGSRKWESCGRGKLVSGPACPTRKVYESMRVRLIKGELGDGTEAGRCTRVVGAALRLRAGRWWGRSQSADVERV